jgi:hypothetical protein
VTAYRWLLDEFSERLTGAGFTEVERRRRPSEGDRRPHAAVAAVAIGLGGKLQKCDACDEGLKNSTLGLCQ